MAERKKYLDLEGLDYFWDKVKAWVNGNKQDKLVSGTNIKTVNNESLLGEGNIEIQITGITMNSASKGTNGVVDLGTVITEHQSLTNYVQKSNTSGLLKNDGTVDTTSYGTYSKPSGGIPAADLASGVIPTVPTISTNVVTDKASDTKTSSPKSVYDEIHPAVATTQPSGGMLPNVLYNLGTLTGTVTFSMAAAADSSIANHWYWTFDTSSTAPTITWPAAITSWFGGSAPTINASKHYEISVLGGIGIAMEV